MNYFISTLHFQLMKIYRDISGYTSGCHWGAWWISWGLAACLLNLETILNDRWVVNSGLIVVFFCMPQLRYFFYLINSIQLNQLFGVSLFHRRRLHYSQGKNLKYKNWNFTFAYFTCSPLVLFIYTFIFASAISVILHSILTAELVFLMSYTISSPVMFQDCRSLQQELSIVVCWLSDANKETLLHILAITRSDISRQLRRRKMSLSNYTKMSAVYRESL